MDSTKLTFEQRDALTLIIAYQDVFALDGEKLGTTSIVKHTIDMQRETPVKQYAHPSNSSRFKRTSERTCNRYVGEGCHPTNTKPVG